MVGVGEGLGDDVPGLVPRQFVFVVENAHELDHGQRGMGVVELDRDLVGEVAPGAGQALEAADDVAQRARDEKVLLDEAQLLARFRLVVRIKNLGDGFALGLGGERLAVTAAVEGLEVDFLRRTRFPKAEEIHRVGAVAGDRNVVGNADDLLGVHPARDVVALVVEDIFDVAVELDRLGEFGPHDFPRRAEAHPVVGQFDLVALVEFLAEEAELVVNAVADGGIIERGERIEEAGGQTAETAVAEAHVVFLAAEVIEVQAQFVKRLLGFLEEADAIEAVGEKPAHEKFEREIIDAPDVLAIMHRHGGDHPFDDPLLHRLRSGQPPVPLRRGLDVVRETELQMVEDRFLHRLGRGVKGAAELGLGGHGA